MRTIYSWIALLAIHGSMPVSAAAQTSTTDEATTQAATPASGLVVAYDKGLKVESPDKDYSLRLGVRTQLRAELNRTEEADEIEARFIIPRMRVQLDGQALGPANRYKIDFELSGSGSPGLKDFYFDHAFSPGLWLRAGQWKRPFNRQELISNFNSEFLERSISNRFAGGGRDLGVGLHNGHEKSPEGIEWAAGVYNGAGDRARQRLECSDVTDITTCTPTTPSNIPADFGPVVAARVGWNQGNIKGYSDGDLEGGPLRFAVGGSYKADLRDLDEDAAGDLQIQHAAEADFMLKAYGVAVSGAVYWVKPGSADALLGFHGQAGVFLVPKQLQGAVRFAAHQLPADGNVVEALGAINWYFQGHSYKWMTDAGIVHTDDDSGETDFQLRTQVQFLF